MPIIGSMEGGGINRIGSSSRRVSSSLWTNTLGEFFARSIQGEVDEDDLKWAALERLPTYDRLRKGILTSSTGGAQEVELTELGLPERKRLLDRLVKEAEEDNEKFLLKLRARLDRVGIKLPTIEVRFEHLSVEGEAHVGTRAVATFLNYTLIGIEEILNTLHILPSRKKKFHILKDVSGIIKPLRMTLLLGPPSSGKTTLLLALAGKLDPTLKLSGRVTYNGHNLDEFVAERTAAYISQHDVHIGEMTVRETLAFSARCQGVGSRYDMLSELSRREKNAGIKPDPDIDIFMKSAATKSEEANVITDYIIKILGLEICADTMVGDEMTRGISGGQKKRVTTGEMLVGPAGALFMDEISTGLDSSTTYGIVNCLKQNIHILDGMALISLLQPAPETYNLFDDIILLSDGQIVYQGPREQVLHFFESVGFKCHERKAVADFLQEVTSKKDQEQYWVRRDIPYRFITVPEFVEAFQSFSVGNKLADELATPFDRSKSHRAALTKVKYGVSTKELLKACFSREFLLMQRGSFFYYFKFFQLVLVAAIGMTLFLRTKMHKDTLMDGSIYSGATFFAVMMIMFNGMAETPLAIAKLPVFYKQRDLQFYPAWIYGLPTWILKIPITLIEVSIWVFLTYYVIGFDPNVGRLFKQFLAFLVMNQMASGLFRANAAICRTMVVANTLGSFNLLMVFILGGYVLSRDDIKKWWKWAFWTSPMMYGQNAIVINEFLGKSWSHVLPNTEIPLGVAVLKSRGFFTEAYWYWLGVVAMFGYILFFNLVMVLALTFLNPFKSHQVIISEELQSAAPDQAVQLERTRASSMSSRSLRRRRGMVLPFEPHSLVFDEVVYSVDMPQEMKSQGIQEDKLVLLRGVSGAFRPGVLTALMGVSGAGKTTLMDVLAGRKTGGYIQGSITVSGYPKKQETFARISGYCEQNDIHSPYVSVFESIIYSAWLRLAPEIDVQTRKMFIEEVMELVELTPLRQMLVGIPGVDGLSTEQRKRLTIAVELVANPSVIFMDEPTSGLDARAAAIVMRTVRNTVDTGRTVVCTIHQPSIDIFEAFDELFLMRRGGEEIYVGPLGHHSCHLISYFEGIEGVSKIKDGYNPATWMLEVTSPAQEAALGVDFAEIYRNSELYKRTKALIQELSQPAPGSKELYFASQYAQPFLSQCLACLWKQHRSYWCNPSYTTVRFLFTIFIALVFGTMFWDLGSKIKKQQDLFNAMGSMYASVLFLGVQNATTAQPIIAVERTVFYRERGAGMYSSMPYAIGQVLIELPYILMQAIVYALIVYSMMSFEWTAVKFCWFLFFMFFTLLYFTFYGMTTVAVSPNQQVATIIAVAFYGLWNLFCGFIVPRPKTPVWWRWFCWTCPVAWTLYGLVVSQFGDIDDLLEDDGIPVNQFIRSYFGFRHDFLWAVGIIVPAFSILFAVMFAVSIRLFNFQTR